MRGSSPARCCPSTAAGPRAREDPEVIAAALAAVALTRGPVAESVTPRSAVIAFRTDARAHAVVRLRDGARVDAGSGVAHVARLTSLTPGRRYVYTVEAGSG